MPRRPHFLIAHYSDGWQWEFRIPRSHYHGTMARGGPYTTKASCVRAFYTFLKKAFPDGTVANCRVAIRPD